MSATLMNPASLTALSLEDVTQLLYREARYLDGRDWDRWLGLYHPEVEFWMPAWDDDDKLVEDPQTDISLIWYGHKGRLDGPRVPHQDRAVKCDVVTGAAELAQRHER